MPLWILSWCGKRWIVLSFMVLLTVGLILPILFSSFRLAQAGVSQSALPLAFPTAPIRPRLPAVVTATPIQQASSPTPSPTAGNGQTSLPLLPTATTLNHTQPDDSQANNAAHELAQLLQTPIIPAPVATPVVALEAVVPDGVVRTVKVPILMYHYLSVPPADADIYRLDLSVTPDLFSAHLDRLQAEGYTTIRLDDLYAHLVQGAPLPAKPVVLTFDDGYLDNYENAFPRLRERGMKATFFVVINFANGERAGYMNWDMLREMAAAGMAIEAHSLDHSSLRRRTPEDLLFQALRCSETIQNQIGQRSRFFSYPAGQYDQVTISVLAETGYWAAVTTLPGALHRSDDLFQLPRVRVRGTTSADDLANLLIAD